MEFISKESKILIINIFKKMSFEKPEIYNILQYFLLYSSPPVLD
jgi:hypothetical protein